MQAITLYNQVLIDIAMQVSGDVEQLFDVAMLTGMSITSDVPAGTPVTANPPAIGKRRYSDLFVQITDRPASNDKQDIPRGGIGYMQVGANFKSS